MKLSGLTKMVKRQLVCNVFHNDESDDFYIGTASAIYCATGFPRPLNRNQMGAMLGISEDTMIEKVVYNDFDCAYKIDFQGFNGRTLEAERSACIYRHDHEGSIPGRNRLADDPVRACVARLPGGWTVGRFL